MGKQRCSRPAGMQAVLLPPHDHDPRRLDREAPQVRLLFAFLHIGLRMLIAS